MSTRSCIARVGEDEGTFAGRYAHSDGYPSWMGPHLWNILHKKFCGNLPKMLAELIDKHPAGWSAAGIDCYCHRNRRPDKWSIWRDSQRKPETEPCLLTHENTESDIEWIYAFDAENYRMYIRDNRHHEDVGFVDLTGVPLTKNQWLAIECGENLERCSHYAWVHFPKMKHSNLSTQTFLGRRPFDFRDAVAFIVNGKRFKSSGSGGNSAYLRRTASRNFPPNSWVSTLIAANGRRLDVPTAKIEDGRYIPYPGVTWVMPPTRDTEHETLIGG